MEDLHQLIILNRLKFNTSRASYFFCNFYWVKFIYHKIHLLYFYNSMIFGIFKELCNYPHRHKWFGFVLFLFWQQCGILVPQPWSNWAPALQTWNLNMFEPPWKPKGLYLFKKKNHNIQGYSKTYTNPPLSLQILGDIVHEKVSVHSLNYHCLAYD